MKFKAVILAGGAGERFWPISTEARPKQFLDVFGGKSLIGQCAGRLKGVACAEGVFVVTTKGLLAATRRELADIPRRNIAGEPMRRNTCAAVALGLGLAGGEGSDVVGFFPADQLVAKPVAFRAALKKAIAVARRSDAIVTLGIKPDHPSPAFGYVEPRSGLFIEKPSVQRAKKLISKGCLWNAGMFVARREVFLGAFRTFAPEFVPLVTGGGSLARKYRELPSVQFDCAVMEKLSLAGGVKVVEADVGWDDVGSYAAVERHFGRDASRNVLLGEVKAVDSSGCTLIGRGAQVVALGLRDVVAVAANGKVLVMHKSRIADIRKIFG